MKHIVGCHHYHLLHNLKDVAVHVFVTPSRQHIMSTLAADLHLDYLLHGERHLFIIQDVTVMDTDETILSIPQFMPHSKFLTVSMNNKELVFASNGKEILSAPLDDSLYRLSLSPSSHNEPHYAMSLS